MARAAYIDSCVFYSQSVRDLFFEMHVSSVFQARWSELVENETRKNLVANYSNDTEMGAKFDKMIRLARKASPDWAIEASESELSLALATETDPKDAPHLAAAIAGGCHYLVTANLKDFDITAARTHGVQIVHPDTFAMECLKNDPESVHFSLATVLRRLKRPALTKEEYAEALRKNRLTNFAAAVLKFPKEP